MGLFDWLFGRKVVEPQKASGWGSSESGNSMTIYRNRRVTVFPSDRGWKFCIAKVEDDEDPYFSDVYRDEDAAKYEALAWMDGRPSRNSTMQEDRQVNRRKQWEEQISQRAALLAILSKDLPLAANLTEVRKIERKVQSHVKQGSWQISEYVRDGVSDVLIRQAEELHRSYEALSQRVEDRVASFKTKVKKTSVELP